ncbi:MAG: hypothetical protein M3390_12415, partial [Chloroflexota bacterium]|nr:hypothetical protein [Chloroflexota bacterium]
TVIVLVGDAPPHIDYPNDHAYPDLLRQAVAKGIKIFPIGASNLDSVGEYVFRQLAQFTMGQFVFLTYENGVSGEPGPSTTHDVPSDFTVQNLDSLVVRLVQGEVANQTGQQPQGSGVVVPVVATVAPPVERTTLLASLQGLFQHVSRELFSWTSLFWLALLAGMILVAQRIPQKARLAPATETRAEAAEEDIVTDADRDAWDQQYVPVPLPTTPTTDPPLLDYPAPQPTVPLPSLEAAMRDHKELAAVQDR